MHRLVVFADVVEQVAQFVRSRRTELGTGGDDSVGALDRVVPRPAPTCRLSERRTQHDVDVVIVPPKRLLSYSTAASKGCETASIRDGVISPTARSPRCGWR